LHTKPDHAREHDGCLAGRHVCIPVFQSDGAIRRYRWLDPNPRGKVLSLDGAMASVPTTVLR
jgi:hypothetical protein